VKYLDFIRVPGGLKTWCDVLPEPFTENPYVVLILAPQDAEIARKKVDGATLGLLKMPGSGGLRGLQVLDPQLKKWPQHEEVFRDFGVRMFDPVYIGRMADIPSKWLTTDLYPMLFYRDAMSTPFVPLRRMVWEVTRPNDDHRDN
jgi:hypothetical protein